MKHQYQLASILSITTLISGLFLVSSKTNADGMVDIISVSVPVACTISGDIGEGEEHNAEIENGIYRDDIGETNMTMYCNDNEGFSVYAVGFTDEEYGKTVLSTASLSSSNDIETGTATSGDTSNWAMKLSTDETATYPVIISDGYSSYTAIPSTYTKVITSDSNTDIGVQGASFTTTYAAYINTTQPASSYRGQVKYTLVHPSTEIPVQPYDTDPGYIAYYPNATSVEGIMERQALGPSDTSAVLSAPNYSRSNYGFAGWNTAYDYSGDFYGPNETISFEAGEYTDGEKGLSLYAVWVESEGIMQNWQGCTSLSRGEVTALTDQRNNQTYAIAKLADNKCWAIENMRIDNTVNSQAMISGSDSIGEGFTVLPLSSNNWDDSDSTAIQFNNSNLTNNYAYGDYYSWPAVIASSASSFWSDETVNTSICPSGWKLPIGGQTRLDSDNNYYILMKSITNEEPNMNQSTGYSYYEGSDYSNLIRRYPNNFLYSGHWDENSSVPGSGYYWSATSYNSNNAYFLYIDSSIIRPGNAYDKKQYGQTFRCIAE